MGRFSAGRRLFTAPRAGMLGLLAGLVVLAGAGDATAGTALTRTAPYDDAHAGAECWSRSCSVVSATADRLTGEIHADAGVDSDPYDQQLLWPASFRYWVAQANATVTADVSMPAGASTWTARVRLDSALVEEEATSGSAHGALRVGFGIVDVAKPYDPPVASTVTALATMPAGDLTLEFQASLARGTYRAYVSAFAQATVSNDGAQIVTTPQVSPPCVIRRDLGRDWSVCVPPTIASQTAHGFANGHARASIDARVEAFSVATS